MFDQNGQLPGEFELIAKYFAPLSEGYPGAFGLLDDAAIISPSAGHDLVAKTDAIVGGVHFHADDPADLVARKALRVNLSDLAGKGGIARAYMLDLILPETTTTAWLSAFASGLAADQRKYGVHLIGGDTNATPGPLTIAVMAFGEVPKGRMLRRNGARAGDLIFVTGTIGDAVLGLKALDGECPALKAEAAASLIERYRLPQPRVETGPLLLDVATATIDVSDGLIADLEHICEVSDVSAAIESKKVPLSPAARQALTDDPTLAASALTGGDDYEILFTAPANAANRIDQISQSSGTPITTIGRVEKTSRAIETRVTVLSPDGTPLKLSNKGWTHF
ncbi:MAG: thiamine-phosphate kinase [Hyphomicrobiales bacterium]|nr:thiamine-phosphate kinase [Hyphomicrobiales bacterium]